MQLALNAGEELPSPFSHSMMAWSNKHPISMHNMIAAGRSPHDRQCIDISAGCQAHTYAGT